MVCLENGIPYLGLVGTEHHKTAMTQRLFDGVLAKMKVEGNKLYVPQFAKILAKTDKLIAKEHEAINKAAAPITVADNSSVTPKSKRKAAATLQANRTKRQKV